MKQTGWILTGGALAVVAALTGGTQRQAIPPPGGLPADLPCTEVSHETAPGMVAVRMHDLQDTRLIGIRERIDLPDREGPQQQIGDNTPGSAIPSMGPPGMRQISQAGRDRGLQLDGEDGETATGADGPSWGWLADDVNAAGIPQPPVPESGGFGLTPSSGSRLHEVGDNRLGTDQGFGTGGNDAFLFQRRADDGF